MLLLPIKNSISAWDFFGGILKFWMDIITTAIGENSKVGITVNGSSNVCFSSPLKTLFLCGTFWGNFKIVNGHNNNRDRWTALIWHHNQWEQSHCPKGTEPFWCVLVGPLKFNSCSDFLPSCAKARNGTNGGKRLPLRRIGTLPWPSVRSHRGLTELSPFTI